MSIEQAKSNFLNEIKSLESSRKSAIRASFLFNLVITLFIGGFITFIILLYTSYNKYITDAYMSVIKNAKVEYVSLSFLIIPVIGMILYSIVMFRERRYIKKVKESVSRVIQDIDPTVSIRGYNNYIGGIINNSKVFNYVKNTSPQLSLCSDVIENNHIKIYDVNIRKKTSKLYYFPGLGFIALFITSFKNLVTRSTTIDATNYSKFEGGLITFDIKKRIEELIILPDNLEKHIGISAKFIQKRMSKKNQLIKLEDPTFEKHFVVYGTDQVEARYILSPAVMYRLSFIREKLNRPLMLSVIGNTVYLYIYSKGGFMGLPKNKKISKKIVDDLYYQLTIATEMDKELSI